MPERFVDRRAGHTTLWVAALLATGVLAGYQRVTGPTWPVSVRAVVPSSPAGGKLPRSHAGESGPLIELLAPDQTVSGSISWRRFPTTDPWTRTEMVRIYDHLVTALPHFPPAAKIEYRVQLTDGARQIVVPPTAAVVLRYRDDVPAGVLLPHIMLMFLGLVVGVRAGLGSVFGERELSRHLPWILAFTIPGGLVLGPVVQKYSFGAYWTGWPVGEDLTDSKTLLFVVVWAVALVLARWRPRWTRPAVLVAALLMIAVYLIPHSARGSQLEWQNQPAAPVAAR